MKVKMVLKAPLERKCSIILAQIQWLLQLPTLLKKINGQSENMIIDSRKLGFCRRGWIVMHNQWRVFGHLALVCVVFC